MSAFRSRGLKCLDIQIKEWPITDRLLSLPTRSALQRHTRSHTLAAGTAAADLYLCTEILMLLSDPQAATGPKSLCLFVCLSLWLLSPVNNAVVMPTWKNPSKLKQLWNLIYYVCMVSTYCLFFFPSWFCSVKSEGKNLGGTSKHTCPEWSQSSSFSSVNQ